MKKAIEQWTKDLLNKSDEILSYAVCIVGNKRSAWITNEKIITYDEKQISTMCKTNASILMSYFYKENRTLWRYMRLVPIQNDNKFPTSKGY